MPGPRATFSLSLLLSVATSIAGEGVSVAAGARPPDEAAAAAPPRLVVFEEFTRPT